MIDAIRTSSISQILGCPHFRGDRFYVVDIMISWECIVEKYKRTLLLLVYTWECIVEKYKRTGVLMQFSCMNRLVCL